jgi:hypothetical protein
LPRCGAIFGTHSQFSLQRIDTKHQSKLDRAKGFSYIRRVKRELRNLIGEFKLGSPFRCAVVWPKGKMSNGKMSKEKYRKFEGDKCRREKYRKEKISKKIYLSGNEESWFEKEKKRRKDDVFSFSLNESHGGEKECT